MRYMSKLQLSTHLNRLALCKHFTMVVSKPRRVAKLFFLITLSGLLMYIILAFYYLHKAYFFNSEAMRHRKSDHYDNVSRFDQHLKYILIKTEKPALFYSIEGQQLFIDYQCPQFTCYLTTNDKLLKNVQEFDAVVINVTDLAKMKFPVPKSEKQLYIFYGMEPSDQVPICNEDADNFFNYTWSYKLNSDIVSPFFTVRDVNDSVVAPRLYPEWTMAMPRSGLKREEVMKFKDKNTAVAMIVQNCEDNQGKIFANRLREALKAHSEELHVIGCGRHKNVSGASIAREYYYVLVNAGGTAQDYITDNVLKAYWNNAVPIVRARADLSKFLPTGSYINAHIQTPEQIAALVHYSINSPSVYRSFFKWRNFYKFRKRQEFEGICQLCSLLNERSSFSNSSAHLREWWDSSNASKIKCGQKLF